MSLTFGSLFSGIGGFDLGFERAGMECKWQVEIDVACQKVLAKHWPNVERYADVKQCGASNLEPVDLICGGFPCQPHSLAGKRLASADERDLWGEFARIIRELKPRWIVAENVLGLLSSENGRFFGRILRDLAACGYDAEWQVLSAQAFGAPHIRERVIIVAYSKIEREGGLPIRQGGSYEEAPDINRGSETGNPTSEGFQNRPIFTLGEPGTFPKLERSDWWAVEPNVGRVANGVPHRVDRLKQLGNAVVPQITEWIGRRIAEVADGH